MGKCGKRKKERTFLYIRGKANIIATIVCISNLFNTN